MATNEKLYNVYVNDGVKVKIYNREPLPKQKANILAVNYIKYNGLRSVLVVSA